MSKFIRPSKKIMDFVKDYEKLSLTAYLPTKNDKPTIGYGMTVYPSGKAVRMGDKITLEKANADFNMLFLKFAQKVSYLVTAPLTQFQVDSLYSLSYNIGITGFQNSTLRKKININPRDNSIMLEFLKWVKQKGVVLGGLVKRRKQEADIWSKGTYESKH